MTPRFAPFSILGSPALNTAFDNLDGNAAKASVLPVNATVARTLDQHLGLFADVADFLSPAMITANDHTGAINAALATGKHVRLLPGPMRVTSQLNCTTHGQIIQGHGRTVSIITVDAAFVLTSRGVFVTAVQEPGPEFVGFAVEFTQVDTFVPTALIAYPPAFLIDNTARCRWRDIRITRGYDGIILLGNCGGASGFEIETSCLRYNISIDGSIDSIRFTNWHCWPFGLNANNAAIFYSAFCYGLRSGRCDDLHLTDCLWLCGRNTAVYIYNSGTGPLQGATFGTMMGCDWDTNGGLQMLDGNVSVLGGEMTLGDGFSQAVTLVGGNLRLVGCWFTQANNSPANIIILVQGGILSVSACEFTYAPDLECIHVVNGQVSIIGNNFIDGLSAGNRAQAVISVEGGAGTISGNVFHGFTSGTRTGISMVGDLAYTVTNNAMNAYNLAVTTTPLVGTFLNNIDASIDLGGYAVVGAIRTLVFEQYSVDANGNVVVPHGLSLLFQKVLSCVGFRRSSASPTGDGHSAEPMTLVQVNPSQAVFSSNGAIPGTPARVMIQYINQPQGGW